MADNSIFDCPICDFRAISAFELDNHFSEIHDERSAKNCPICNSSFLNDEDLQFHVNAHFERQSMAARETCPICNDNFTNTEELNMHVNKHFEGDGIDELQQNIEEYKTKQHEKWQKARSKTYEIQNQQPSTSSSENPTMEKLIFMDEDSGQVYTNILDRLREFLCDSNSEFKLCSTCHLYTSGPFDKGWSCGFRNLQMLLSSIQSSDEFAKCKIFSDNFLRELGPIRKLQSLIERAWSLGFDERGAQQLGHRLVNTKKWIGATEIVTVLSSYRIKCVLVDVHHKSTKTGNHSHIFDWVKNHFSGPNSKFPLYLQHQGHSRTIVGVEQSKKGANLIIFDPGCSRNLCNEYCNGKRNQKNTWKLFRRSVVTFFKEQYQIVAVTGMMKTGDEYETAKILRSISLSS